MGKCNITTIKFKEFPLRTTTDLSTDIIPSTPPTYNHVDENEVFVVGYQYKTDTNCPEVKIRLADIMNGEGGGDGGGGGDDMFIPGYVNMSFIADIDYGTVAGQGNWVEQENGTTSLILNLPKQLLNVDIAYDADTNHGDGNHNGAWGEIVSDVPQSSEGQRTMHLHLLPNTGGGQPGADGESAYEIAVDNGFEGTEEEWLESLAGDPGPAGKDGTVIDLYDVAVTVQGSRVSRVTAQTGNDAQIDCYDLGDNPMTWRKFDPSDGTYYSCTNPTVSITSSNVVEIGPPDTTDSCKIAYNLAYGLFGTHDTDEGFCFFAVRDPEIGNSEQKTIHFSVKVYKNLGSSDSDSNGGGETNL